MKALYLLIIALNCSFVWLWFKFVGCGAFNKEKITVVFTRSPYLFMLMVNGLIPMKNPWLFCSIICLFCSQMAFLCMSSCTITQTHHRIRAYMHLLLVFALLLWSQSHHVIVGYAMAALPDLPLGQDRLIWVWRHVLWAAQQDREQSCPQQKAGLLHCKDKSITVGSILLFVPTLKLYYYQFNTLTQVLYLNSFRYLYFTWVFRFSMTLHF